MKTKKKKGEYGYLAIRKRNQLIYSIISFAIVLIVLFTGIFIHHTRNNVYTVGAVVLVLPAAKIFVSYLLMARFKSTPVEEYNNINSITTVDVLYDLVLSVKDKIVFVPLMAVTNSEIIIYTESTKIDSQDLEEGIQKFIVVNGFRPKIKVIKDKNVFLKKIKGMSKDENDTSRLIENICILNV